MPTVIELINEALTHDTPSRVPWRARLEMALFEIERIQEAKRKFSLLCDEKGAENVKLRAALKPFADIALAQDEDKSAPDMIDGPDLCITPAQIRAARRVLGLEQRGRDG